MKNLTLKSVLYFFFITALLLGGCKGDQGDPGPAGKDGTNGTNGTNGKDGVDGTNGTNGTNGKDGTNGTNGTNGKDGTNGTDGKDGADGTNGANGVGFDEAVKYGGVTINLAGKRPDGINFTKSLNFKFSSSNVDYSQINASDNQDVSSHLKRFLTFDDDVSYDSYVALNLEYYTGDGTYYWFDMSLVTSVTTSDFKYFIIDDDYYNTEGSNFTNASFTNYSYNPATGKLKYNFSFTVPAVNNATGYDLNVTGVVDATVFQYIGGDCFNCGRRAHRPSVKAVMMDLPH